MISIVTLLFEFAILAVFNSTGTTDVGNFVAGVLILLHSFVTIASFGRNKRLKKFSRLLTLAYLLRLFFICIDLFAYPRIVLPDGHSDEEMFYINAADYTVSGYTRRGFYPQLMGTLFRFIGINRFFGQYVSMLPSLVALVFLVFTLYELEKTDTASLKIFRIVCILPYNAVLSSLFMREAFIYMFLAISYYHFVLWTKSKKELEFYIAAGFILPAALFHSGTIAALVGYIIVRLIYDNKREVVNITAKNLFATIIIAALSAFVLSRSGNSFLGKFNSLDSLEDIANTYDFARSSYARYVGNSNNLANFILYSPLRFIYFVLSPVPWLWRGITDIAAFMLSTMFYIVAIWRIIKYLRTHDYSDKRKALVVALMIVSLAILFVFSWGTSNAGTALRHRDKTLILFSVLWILCSDETKPAVRKYVRGRRRAY